jgi:hypothetical protein
VIFASKIVLDEISHHLEQMISGVSTIQTMIFVRVIKRPELFARQNQCSFQLNRILKMDVVIARAVYQ